MAKYIKIKDRIPAEGSGVVSVAEPVPEKSADEKQADISGQLEAIKTETDSQAGDKPRRKHRRRTNKEILEAEAPSVSIAEEAPSVDPERLAAAKQSFAMFSNVALDLLCARLPNPIPVTDGEKEVFSLATSAMVEKYFPVIAGYDVELSFGLAVILIFAPRLVKKKE